MRGFRTLALGMGLAALSLAPAAASDEALELWLNPAVAWSLDDRTDIRLETAQRLRPEGRPDTYFARLWLNRKLTDAVTISGAMERRANEPGNDETRLIQQLSGKRGIWRGRLRLEQRFVDDQQTGHRLQPRLGVELPVGDGEHWKAFADGELFLTLRSTSAGGDTGLTAVRTRVGASYKVSDRLSLTLAYLRQQDIDRSGPDRVGHAPLIGVDLSF